MKKINLGRYPAKTPKPKKNLEKELYHFEVYLNKTFGENKQFWYHKTPDDYWLNSVKNAVKFIQEKQDEEVRKENLNQRIRKMLFRN